jgi:hypothetical protein
LLQPVFERCVEVRFEHPPAQGRKPRDDLVADYVLRRYVAAQ